jgi:hypothetical protein
MLGRTLKRVANRVIVGNNERGWLMSINQKQSETGGPGEPILDFRPGRRGIFTAFLRIQGNGGLLRHQLLGITFQVRGAQQLSAGHGELRVPSSAHEEVP